MIDTTFQLSTTEQGLYQELLVNGIKELMQDFKKTAESYGLPTDERSIYNLMELVVSIEKKKLDQEDAVIDSIPF